MKSLRELDGKLIQNWYVACLSDELRPGKILSRTLYGKHYAIFRDKSGKTRALEDRCAHRGAKLSEGRCENDQLTCPYHGWVYDTSGLVVHIPSEGPGTDCSDRNWRIPSAQLFEQDGAIWLWTGEGAPDPATPPWRFPGFGDPKWVSYFMITDFDNEVCHLAQNFMDVPHTVYVHSKWFRNRKLLEVPYSLEVGNGRVKATYHKPKDKIGVLLGRVFNPNRLPMDHTDEFIFPNLTRVDYRYGEHGFIINSQCTPVDRYKTRVYTWIAYHGNWLAPLVKPLMRMYTRQVIQQDVDIMQNQGSNLQRFEDRSDWRSTAADEIHVAISRIRELGTTDPADALKIAFKKEKVFWI